MSNTAIMPAAASTPPSLTFEETDDLLYLTRANENVELQQTIDELSKKHHCHPKDILQACIDPESGNTVLHFCSANGLSDLLSSLLIIMNSGEAQVEAQDRTVAHLVNSQNAQGNTPLHWAAYNGHLSVVKKLVDAGADMWVKNQAGHLAMFEAERADKNEVVQYLLEAGGKKVEQGGQEGVPAADEEVDVQEAGSSSAAAANTEGGADVEMDGA